MGGWVGEASKRVCVSESESVHICMFADFIYIYTYTYKHTHSHSHTPAPWQELYLVCGFHGHRECGRWQKFSKVSAMVNSVI